MAQINSGTVHSTYEVKMVNWQTEGNAHRYEVRHSCPSFRLGHPDTIYTSPHVSVVPAYKQTIGPD